MGMEDSRKTRDSTGSLIIPLTPRKAEQRPGCSAGHAMGRHHRTSPITLTFYRMSMRVALSVAQIIKGLGTRQCSAWIPAVY